MSLKAGIRYFVSPITIAIKVSASCDRYRSPRPVIARIQDICRLNRLHTLVLPFGQDGEHGVLSVEGVKVFLDGHHLIL